MFLNPDGIAAQIQDPPDENLSPIQFVVDGKRKPPAQLAMVAKNLSMNSRVEQERVDFRIDGIEKKIYDANVLGFVKTKARLQIPLSEIEDSDFHRADTAARTLSLASFQSENFDLPSALSRSASRSAS